LPVVDAACEEINRSRPALISQQAAVSPSMTQRERRASEAGHWQAWQERRHGRGYPAAVCRKRIAAIDRHGQEIVIETKSIRRRLFMEATLQYWTDGGWYVGKLKEVPGVFSQGETLDDLIENIRDAYQLIVEDEVLETQAEHKEIAVAL